MRFREQAQAQTLLAADRDVERAKAIGAKEQVETALRKLALALTDMHTSQGLVAGERGDPAEAVLWFASAARIARDDPERRHASIAFGPAPGRTALPSAPRLPPRRRLWGFRTICLPSRWPLLARTGRAQARGS